jgi:hypothetical protein
MIVAVPIWASINAEEVNIIKETEKYKNIFAKEKDYEKLSEHLGAFFGYLENACNLLTRELHENESLSNSIHSKNRNNLADEYFRFLEVNGLKLGFEFDDGLYLYPDMIFFRDKLLGALPNIILEYFSIEAEDREEGYETDSALDIPWDVLRKKIIRYENYFKRVCEVDCPYIINNVSENIMMYLRAYLLGLNNSSIDELLYEAKESYERFLVENKESRFKTIIEKYYRDLERNHFEFGYWKEKTEENLREISINPTILDSNNKEVSIYALADKYLNEMNLQCSGGVSERRILIQFPS